MLRYGWIWLQAFVLVCIWVLHGYLYGYECGDGDGYVYGLGYGHVYGDGYEYGHMIVVVVVVVCSYTLARCLFLVGCRDHRLFLIY